MTLNATLSKAMSSFFIVLYCSCGNTVADVSDDVAEFEAADDVVECVDERVVLRVSGVSLVLVVVVAVVAVLCCCSSLLLGINFVVEIFKLKFV